MASIERTAYPKFSKIVSNYELEQYFYLTNDEKVFVKDNTKSPNSLLSMSILLKTCQHLGYFPKISSVPDLIIQYIKHNLGLSNTIEPEVSEKTLYNQHIKIRQFLKIKAFTNKTLIDLEKLMHHTARLRDDPIDIINIAIVELFNNNIELPAYYALNRLAGKVRENINNEIYSKIMSKLPTDVKNELEKLLQLKSDKQRTSFNDLKELPKNATITHLKDWIDRMIWLENIVNVEY